MGRLRRTGSVRPSKIGGYGGVIAGEHRAWAAAAGQREGFHHASWWRSSARRGLKVDHRSVWEFVHEERLSFKKKSDRWRRTVLTSRPASAMEQISGWHRSFPPGVHRRDLDQDHHGAAVSWAPSGEQLNAKAPPPDWQTTTFLAALRHGKPKMIVMYQTDPGIAKRNISAPD